MKIYSILCLVVLAVVQHAHSQTSLSPDVLRQLATNPNTGLPWNPLTGVQYDPGTGLPITTLAQVQSLFPGITVEQLQAFFPGILTGTTASTLTTSSVSNLPINPLTGLPYNPITGVQYNPITGLPILTQAQAQALFPNATAAELAVLFPYLFTTTTSSTINLGTILTNKITNKVNFWNLWKTGLLGLTGITVLTG